MSGNCELGRGLRRREKNATEGGAGRFEKPAPDTRAAHPEAHESLISRKTVDEVPLTRLSRLSNAGSMPLVLPRALLPVAAMNNSSSNCPVSKKKILRLPSLSWLKPDNYDFKSLTERQTKTNFTPS